MRTSLTGFRFFLSIAALASVLILLSGVAAEGDAVLSPAKRQESLDQAKGLLGDKTAPAPTKNPFSPEGFGDVAPVPGPSQGTVTVTGPRSPKDLLQIIASSLKPRLVVLAGQPVLFFGQKRVKAGGFLTITFEGNEYTLEVVSIEQPNFTLRLNREEFTRPIK
jgi:hypothetical protein